MERCQVASGCPGRCELMLMPGSIDLPGEGAYLRRFGYPKAAHPGSSTKSLFDRWRGGGFGRRS
jgi:hypothetical protein